MFPGAVPYSLASSGTRWPFSLMRLMISCFWSAVNDGYPRGIGFCFQHIIERTLCLVRHVSLVNNANTPLLSFPRKRESSAFSVWYFTLDSRSCGSGMTVDLSLNKICYENYRF